MKKCSPCGFHVYVGLFLVGLLLSTLIVLCTASSIPKPAVPEFTLEVIEHPYDVPPTTTIDPYTGNTTITRFGYHEENRSIEVTIKNPPFSPYTDVDGNNVGLFYNITVKGHYENTWDYCFNNPYRGLLNASDSDYTIISMTIGNHLEVPSGGYPLEGVDTGDQVDFQVQAQIGYYNITYTGMWAPVPGGDFYYVFTGESSGWSETQTITIPASTQSPENSSSSTSTPNQTTEPTTNQTSQTLQLAAIIGTIIAIVVVGATLLIYFKKRMGDRQLKRDLSRNLD